MNVVFAPLIEPEREEISHPELEQDPDADIEPVFGPPLHQFILCEPGPSKQNCHLSRPLSATYIKPLLLKNGWWV